MKFFLATLLAALAVNLFAQTNYHSGYIVKNDGDTVKGYIDYREWDRTPKAIHFKIDETGKEVQEFEPQTIKAFEITGLERYISYSGLISMDKTILPNLPTGLDTSRASQTIFLKQVTTGRHLALYQQRDDLKTRFFLVDGTGPVTELRYYQYYLDMEDKLNQAHYDNKVTEATYYKGQLIYYINLYNAHDNKLTNLADRARFNDDDLKKVIDRINGSNSGRADIIKRKSTRFFVGTGANYTQTEYHTVDYRGVATPGEGDNLHVEPVGSSIIYSTVSPKLNAGLDFFVNPNVQQLVIRTEVTLSYARARFDMTNNSVYSFKQYTAGIAPQILFNIYNKDAFKFYVNGGISFNLSAYADNKLSNSTSSVLEKPYALDNYWASFPLQAGMVFNRRIELAFTYSGFAAYSTYEAFSISNRTMGVGLKYLLGK
jgi:hypothetical protein